MRGGKRVRCCQTAHPPQQQAVLSARCDQGAPAVLAAATSWPVVRPDVAEMSRAFLGRPRFVRPADQSVPSASPRPLTPPPCLL